jgi:DNA repair protein RecO (recombination protein O)
MAGRSYKTEAIVLRSMRFGEADRVLHLYTLERGRVGAVAKGIRRTKSRFGGRLEPMSHVELVLHEGRGELQTITGVQLVRPHSSARDGHYRLSVGFVALEAVLKLFPEQEGNDRAFAALARFLDLLDEVEARDGRPALDPLVLAFQLKLLWLAGYLPHLTSCAECGADAGLVGYSPRAGGAVCANCRADAMPLSAAGLRGIEALLRAPLADVGTMELGARAARDALAVIASSYEFHGGFRLRTLSA